MLAAPRVERPEIGAIGAAGRGCVLRLGVSLSGVRLLPEALPRA